MFQMTHGMFLYHFFKVTIIFVVIIHNVRRNRNYLSLKYNPIQATILDGTNPNWPKARSNNSFFESMDQLLLNSKRV